MLCSLQSTMHTDGATYINKYIYNIKHMGNIFLHAIFLFKSSPIELFRNYRKEKPVFH